MTSSPFLLLQVQMQTIAIRKLLSLGSHVSVLYTCDRRAGTLNNFVCHLAPLAGGITMLGEGEGGGSSWLPPYLSVSQATLLQ